MIHAVAFESHFLGCHHRRKIHLIYDIMYAVIRGPVLLKAGITTIRTSRRNSETVSEYLIWLILIFVRQFAVFINQSLGCKVGRCASSRKSDNEELNTPLTKLCIQSVI